MKPLRRHGAGQVRARAPSCSCDEPAFKTTGQRPHPLFPSCDQVRMECVCGRVHVVTARPTKKKRKHGAHARTKLRR